MDVNQKRICEGNKEDIEIGLFIDIFAIEGEILQGRNKPKRRQSTQKGFGRIFVRRV